MGGVSWAPISPCAPAGRVLNRFSKDLGFMDDVLPFFFFDYLGVSEQIEMHAALYQVLLH